MLYIIIGKHKLTHCRSIGASRNVVFFEELIYLVGVFSYGFGHDIKSRTCRERRIEVTDMRVERPCDVVAYTVRRKHTETADIELYIVHKRGVRYHSALRLACRTGRIDHIRVVFGLCEIDRLRIRIKPGGIRNRLFGQDDFRFGILLHIAYSVRGIERVYRNIACPCLMHADNGCGKLLHSVHFYYNKVIGNDIVSYKVMRHRVGEPVKLRIGHRALYIEYGKSVRISLHIFREH